MCEETLEKYTCCFFGHREIIETEELKERLYFVIENLIVVHSVDTFLFGSKSRFNSLCYEQVTKSKEKHPHIQRVYVRAEFPDINKSYEDYLIEHYEGTYYPETVKGAGKAVYVERNRYMIDKSRFCVVYCQEGYSPSNRKSGTQQALDYAMKKSKVIIKL